MVIESASLMKEIVSTAPSQPPEIGGILGGTNQVVSLYALDKGIAGSAMCSYTPDVIQLNHQIQRWAKDRIEFMGMFHVHFGGAATLSPGDRRYIVKIMEAMPPQIKWLYFPVVVMPEREMVVYKAERGDGKITITQDEIEYQGGF